MMAGPVMGITVTGASVEPPQPTTPRRQLTLVARVDPGLSDLLREIRYNAVTTVSLGYAADAFPGGRPRGFGFLVARTDVPWAQVDAFHLDEYLGLPLSHPASFRKYLQEQPGADRDFPGERSAVSGDQQDRRRNPGRKYAH